MKIIEMTPEELIRYPVRTALDTRPNNNLLIIKTNIKSLGVCIFNVFPPYGKIFWCFGIYKKMSGQLRMYEEIYRSDGVKYIDSLRKLEKKEKQNMSIFTFFYPIVSGKGDAYRPRINHPEDGLTWLLAQRHISVMFPLEREEKVLSYFNRQLTDFGDLCFREVDEKVEVVGSIAMENLYGYDFLCKHPLKMSRDQKLQILTLLIKDNFLSAIDKKLSLILSVRGGIGVNSNIFKEKNPDPLNLEICKRRFEICSNALTPITYEDIGFLSDLAPEDEYLIPLFEERLSKLKEKYPVMDMAFD